MSAEGAAPDGRVGVVCLSFLMLPPNRPPRWGCRRRPRATAPGCGAGRRHGRRAVPLDPAAVPPAAGTGVHGGDPAVLLGDSRAPTPTPRRRPAGVAHRRGRRGRGAAVNRAVAALLAAVGFVAVAPPGLVWCGRAGALRAAAGRHPWAGILAPAARPRRARRRIDAPAAPAGPRRPRRAARAAWPPGATADPTAEAPVGWSSAPGLLLRRAALDSVDGFDPRYPGRLDDLDLADRLAAAAGSLHVPSATVVYACPPGPTGPRPVVISPTARRGPSARCCGRPLPDPPVPVPEENPSAARRRRRGAGRGQGTRLRPLTLSAPKPMLPTAGVPFLTHLLSRIGAAGIEHVVLGTSYQAEMFSRALRRRLRARAGDRVRRRGRAVGHRRRHPQRRTTSCARHDVMVFNGDVLSGVDLAELLATPPRRTTPTSRCTWCGCGDPRAFGCVPTDADGRVTAFLEKTEDPPTDQINAGCYVFRREVIDRSPPGRAVSVERETFPALLASGCAGLRPRRRLLLARHGHARPTSSRLRRPGARHRAFAGAARPAASCCCPGRDRAPRRRGVFGGTTVGRRCQVGAGAPGRRARCCSTVPSVGGGPA